eukprot:TRINITY_DN8706_c0_g2_i1.p1 TRINITY_DN8706_c0_g2~~TRINITY_DN8706_c0_g2_i1.p1  ORF type:complete len:443 (-),score=98.90 TRINITY_DN8706_c0_g2_i1:158-1486(-)
MKELKYIVNEYPDFSVGMKEFNESAFMEKLELEHSKSILCLEIVVLALLAEKYPASVDYKVKSDGSKSYDSSFYSGSGGNVLLYWRQYKLYKHQCNKDKMQEHLQNAVIAFETNVKVLKSGNISLNILKSPSFFIGSAGLYTIGTLIYKEMGNMSEMLNCYKKVMGSLMMCKGKEANDELIYGNAGYLYCLLLLYMEDRTLFNCKTEIIEVVDLIKKEGAVSGIKGILIYTFPRTSKNFYYGAAHGLMGILYILMKAMAVVEDLSKDRELLKSIEASSEYLLSLQYPSGSFPKAYNAESEKLVQFCHGAPGAIPFLLSAYKLLGRDEYFNAALKAGNATWQQGILLKGNGLCHGITGNAYTLHTLYRGTGDDKWKYRSCMLVDASWNPEVQSVVRKYQDGTRVSVGVPDAPYSLMEGNGGTAVLYADLMGKPELVRFPGFEL